jgi:hypothetical protein
MQETPYLRPLPLTLAHSGYTLTQVKRNDTAAIYEKTKPGIKPTWEVIRIRHEKAKIHPFSKAELPDREAYPRDEEWGTHGWTYTNIEDARTRFETLARPISTTPTCRTSHSAWS